MSPELPDWLEPVRDAAATITADDLSRYVPPEDADARDGAVLMLFGEGPSGPDLLLTERAHHMRSHPGQVSFPGGSIDPTDADAAAAALREAQEETGLDPSGIDVFGTLPELWLPPSNFAVTTVLGWWRAETPVTVVDPDEVHRVLRVPVHELLDPAHRVTTIHPMGRMGPGFLIGPRRDLLLWGFTAGIISRLFDHLGWTRDWDPEVTFELEDRMIFGSNAPTPPPAMPAPNTSFQEGTGPMNLLDWLLVLLVVAYALSGYWQGFVTGAFATIGLLLGGLFGIWLAPQALGDAAPSLWVSLGALFIVILSATIGQAMLQYAGAKVRDKITWQPARAVDAVGGAVLSALAVLLVAWALGVAVSGSRIGPITPQVRNSTVLAKVNEALPTSAGQALQAFNTVVGTSFFPRYLEPFAREQIAPVGPPPRRIAGDPDVVDAEASVLKIHGDNKCGRGVEGTGFLISDDRLMTNAHVVAGVSDPEVLVGDDEVDARVVYYNADLDVAVLDVDGIDRPHLRFDLSAVAGDGAAVLGYPQDGPYDVQPVRIRAQQRLRSPDIYGQGKVLREVYSLRGTIRPGNSGGPMVSSGGEVTGVVFAASVTDADTGYALTAGQVREAAAAGLTATDEVGTGDCAS